jgi:uncharacterized integral membrane protein
MRLLSIVLKIVVFGLVLVFALANTQPVWLTLIPGVAGLAFHAPLALWLLAAFVAGVLGSLLVLLPTLVAAWRREKRES